MKSIQTELSERIVKALASIGLKGDPLVFPSQDAKFGDYQSNCAMGLGKKAGRKPRELAEEIVSRLQIDDISETPQIAGPGFINFRIRPEFLGGSLSDLPPASDPLGSRMGIESAASPEVVVVDLSSPNLAKEMHVGHLRSTVIGDCVARCMEFMGHTVHRDNHVGDWGTQFGMLVAHLRHVRPDLGDNPDQLVIGDLETFYIEAKSRFDADEDFKKESRESVVALQQGDPQTRLIWKAFCDESLRHCHAIYDRLKVDLVDRGESFYADLMHEVVRRLETLRGQADGPVEISDGALCIFLDGFTTRDGERLPLIVRKADGGFNYASSDLATILHRVEQLGATRIIYVVGLPQKQHFEMVFAAARRVGWVNEDV
ncbi:MAG: arginine--tRNA ligase, partial [Planctomycetes bacterium]|nr:arginine--tRNA ligase [Planctomycetota bacterium]